MQVKYANEIIRHNTMITTQTSDRQENEKDIFNHNDLRALCL